MKRALIAGVVVLGGAIGAGINWWLNLPWLSFNHLEATYSIGDEFITLTGEYYVRHECGGSVIWRTEALATDGQIALYGPKPAPPTLDKGTHKYASTIPLLQNIRPDGWRATVIVTCPGAQDTVASPSVLVEIVPKERP